jgi:hypothetical protein
MICEKCWADSAGDYDRYLELIEARKDKPCTPEEQSGEYRWRGPHEDMHTPAALLINLALHLERCSHEKRAILEHALWRLIRDDYHGVSGDMNDLREFHL